MYKKAGIVVGLVAMLLAGFIYWYSHSLDTKKAADVKTTPAASSTSMEKPEPKPVPVSQTTEKTTGEVKGNSSPDDSSKSYNSKPVSPVTGSITDQEQERVFKELEEGDLGKPVATSTEILIVVKKKLVLMDGAYGTTENKQLVYAVDMLGNDNSTRLTLYLNQSAYSGVSLGDRLKVQYFTYKNASGVKFPVVISAEKPE
jgi:hypothetical protein